MKNKFSKSSIAKLPQTPGVYKYFNSKGQLIYIGKANNLRSRMYSYTLQNLQGKTKQLVQEIKSFDYIKVDSEIEALLLEAKLIGEHLPKYNISLRDDKKPLCIRITGEKYPRVITARSRDRQRDDYAFLGPFPSSRSVNSILHMLRHIFPYSQHKLGKRACLYNQLGLCNPCPNNIEVLEGDQKIKQFVIYKRNIRRIKLILEGKFPSIMRTLEREMKSYSDKLEFEKAQIVKRQIDELNYITRPSTNINVYLSNPNFLSDTRDKELGHLREILSSSSLKFKGKLSRIECFDVAHLRGTSVTASMITFIDAEESKDFYRHFKLKRGGSDTDSLREVVQRRIKHFNTWGKPDLIIVDGGKPQVSVFWDELSNLGIPVVGIAKRFETLVIPNKNKEYELLRLNPPALYLVQKMRDEAHRFARRYHHHLVRKSLLE